MAPVIQVTHVKGRWLLPSEPLWPHIDPTFQLFAATKTRRSEINVLAIISMIFLSHSDSVRRSNKAKLIPQQQQEVEGQRQSMGLVTQEVVLLYWFFQNAMPSAAFPLQAANYTCKPAALEEAIRTGQQRCPSSSPHPLLPMEARGGLSLSAKLRLKHTGVKELRSFCASGTWKGMILAVSWKQQGWSEAENHYRRM